MWTYQQFVLKHAQKYSKLTATEKKKRYQDYVRTQQQPVSNAQPNRRSRTNARSSRTGVRASQTRDTALQRYLQLVRNPFTADSVGLPVFPSPPSSKATSWLKTVFTIGTGGVGWILGKPSVANDRATWHVSTATASGISIVASDAPLVPPTTGQQVSGTTGANGVTVLAQSNLQYPANLFSGEGGTLRQRIVCTAVRARYIGTQDKLGGNMLPFVHPEHAVQDGTQQSFIQSWEGVNSIPCTRQWVGCVAVPVHRTELEYVHLLTTPAHDSVETSAGNYIVLMATGAPGNQYEVEVVVHIEYIGTATQTKTDNGVTSSYEGIIGSMQNMLSTSLPTKTTATAVNSGLVGSIIGMGALAGLRRFNQ
jgi:hypothetical protein